MEKDTSLKANKSKNTILKDAIYKSLKDVEFNNQNLVDIGLISSISAYNGSVSLGINIGQNSPDQFEELQILCKKKINKIKDVKKITIILISDNSHNTSNKNAENINSNTNKKSNNIKNPKQDKIKNTTFKNRAPINGVKYAICVAAGKGGVGKSTVSLNLAVTLKNKGLKIALVDADIYGPSIVKMLGAEKSELLTENGKLIPVKKNGLSFVSSSLLMEKEEQAIIWRAPMVTKLIRQMISSTKWEDIDLMIIDLPPGTGDIQLSLASNFNFLGAVLVTTPQEIALLDVKKTIDMFNKLEIEILGLIENMSYFVDPSSFNKTYIFGKQGGEKLAKQYKIKFLGDIPIDPNITQCSDNGLAIVEEHAQSEAAMAYQQIADLLYQNHLKF